MITTAMHNKIGLSKLGACVFPYPTYAEAIKHLSDQYNRKRLLRKAEKSVVEGLNELKLN